MARHRRVGAGLAVAACAGLAVAACAALLAPATTPAAVRPTINAAPNPTVAGDAVVIYGRAPAGANVVLWHRINPRPRFTPVSRTAANAAGLYEFRRAEGVVDSNRNWFVVVNKRRSRTVHERVYALVTLTGPTDTNLITGTPTTFTGTVSPRHVGQRIVLQRQNADGPVDPWHTIDRARIGADGSYTIVHRFRVPGDANLRALFAGDRRNLPSPSDALSYQISQRQNPQLSIAASANPIDAGQSVTISGQLRGATSPQPVTLHARTARSGFAPVATTMTDAAGNYSFAQTPIANTFYKVTATPQHSAVLFEGVHPVVSGQVDQTNVLAGTTLTFSGSVSPDKTGHPIYLQRQNPSGQGWHNIGRALVQPGSTFTLTHRVTVPGEKRFRVLIAGGPLNQRDVSQTFAVTVTANPNHLT